jgi:hypothetical protein
MAEIIVPRRREDFFDSRGEPTLRFIRWVEAVTEKGNETSETVDSSAFVSGFSAQIQQLRKELNGLPDFTIDTTGFTVDTTLITTDKATA